MSKEAMKMVLEALIWANAKGENWEKVVYQAIRPMQEALALEQKQGEPVAIVCNKGPKFHHVAILTDSGKQLEDGTKLYTTPRGCKPLTDEQIKHMLELFVVPPQHVEMVVRAIETAHGIKE